MKIKFWKTVLLAGFLVGSIDIISALTSYYIQTGKSPVFLLRYIASAVFGKKTAFDENNNLMPVTGLLFHYAIAYGWTIFFFLIYPRLQFMSVNRVLTGFIYGIFIWVMMTYVVLPLTSIGLPNVVMKQVLIGISVLIAAIGLPLSFIAYRCFYGLKSK